MIKIGDDLNSQKTHQAAKRNKDHNDDWSEECLEYLFDNEIWLPDFVSLPLCVKV